MTVQYMAIPQYENGLNETDDRVSRPIFQALKNFGYTGQEAFPRDFLEERIGSILHRVFKFEW